MSYKLSSDMRRIILIRHANLCLPGDITFFDVFSSMYYCLRIHPLIFVCGCN